MQRIDGGDIGSVLADLDADALALRPAHRISRVLVEAGEERIVVRQVDDPRLPDLERLGRPAKATPAEDG